MADIAYRATAVGRQAHCQCACLSTDYSRYVKAEWLTAANSHFL